MSDPKHIMVTCYDATFAKIIAQAGAVDSILVGDSLGMVIQGQNSTVNVTMEQMIYHIEAVARGIKNSKAETKPLLIGDMPIHSYRTPDEALQNASTMIKAGAQMVKVEGPVTQVVRALKDVKIPVCGHIGLTPQSVLEYKLQGKTESEADRLFFEAIALDEAGVDLLVLEMIPAALAKKITEKVSAITIGIGAGADCDGQVLVLYDLLGFNPDFNPKFLKKFVNGYDVVSNALKKYSEEVRASKYPAKENSFLSKETPRHVEDG